MRDLRIEPFAVELHRRCEGGATIDDLAAETGIPRDRIDARLRAASLYLSRRGPDVVMPMVQDQVAPLSQ